MSLSEPTIGEKIQNIIDSIVAHNDNQAYDDFKILYNDHFIGQLPDIDQQAIANFAAGDQAINIRMGGALQILRYISRNADVRDKIGIKQNDITTLGTLINQNFDPGNPRPPLEKKGDPPSDPPDQKQDANNVPNPLLRANRRPLSQSTQNNRKPTNLNKINLKHIKNMRSLPPFKKELTEFIPSEIVRRSRYNYLYTKNYLNG